jgi:phosphoribosylformimino-5-aminoimidazole carboxamide ribotide isomerase
LTTDGPAAGVTTSVSAEWIVYPAIDLREGRVVRLRQGDPSRETEYADDPLGVACRWHEAGAAWLHVVNLDGALDKEGGTNLRALARIAQVGPYVQFGGGIRDMDAFHAALDLGATRVVVGTAAVEDANLVEASLETFGPDRVAVGIDTRGGRVRTHGWQQETAFAAEELARRWASRGVRRVILTDVARDGMGTGLDADTAAQLARETGLHVIASGGVATLDDVRRACEAGLSGVIIGRALYDGKVALEDALSVVRCESATSGR